VAGTRCLAEENFWQITSLEKISQSGGCPPCARYQGVCLLTAFDTRALAFEEELGSEVFQLLVEEEHSAIRAAQMNVGCLGAARMPRIGLLIVTLEPPLT
jgi:hypothetical protein